MGNVRHIRRRTFSPFLPKSVPHAVEMVGLLTFPPAEAQKVWIILPVLIHALSAKGATIG